VKYRAGKIKREHSVIERLWPVLEHMAESDLITTIIPGPISPLHSNGFEITFQRFTETGLRLLAKNGSAVQEVYAVAPEKEAALAWLNAEAIVDWAPPPPPRRTLPPQETGEQRKSAEAPRDTGCIVCGRPILAGTRAVRLGTQRYSYAHIRCAK